MFKNSDTEPDTFKLHRRHNNSNRKNTNLQTSGRNVVTTVGDLNFNTKSINDLKKHLDKVSENSGHKLKLSPPKTGIPEIKSPILMKNFNLPGHGLWVQDLSKSPIYNRKEVTDIINSDIYSKNKNITEDIKQDEDKKIIEILKLTNSELQKQLSESLVKYYDSVFRAQRAEQQKDDYYEVVQTKIEENNEIFTENEILSNENSALTQSLNFSKKEVERLNTENIILKEADETKSKKIVNLERRLELLINRLQEVESENGNFKTKFHEQNDQIEIHLSTIERLKNKGGGETVDTGKRNSKRDNSGKSKEFTFEQKIREQSEEIIKLQLQVFDLKRRLSEDEKLRVNLFDVIKSKKQKNKSLKKEMDNIVYVNEETGKENKWVHDLILQKDNVIKVHKDKINKLTSDIKNLNKEMLRYKSLKTEDKAIETDRPYDDGYVKVASSPLAFKMK